jgi:pilus assembly protein CpaC
MKYIFLILAVSFGSGFSRAQTAGNEQISITAGKSFIIDNPANVERVAVATEGIVEAVAVSQREVVLNGKAPGATTVIIWLRDSNARKVYNVNVEASTEKLEALRRRLLTEIGDSVQVELEDKSVLVRGMVRNPADAERALALAAMLGKPVSMLTVATPPAMPQILLKVRFADVDRSVSTDLGANLFSTANKMSGSLTTQQFSPPTPKSFGTGGSSFNLSDALNIFLFRPDLDLGATIKALESKNLVQILAEPNLLAMAGKEASFLAGGEFPYPVVQSSAGGFNNVTIMFREFGIRLNFTATITPRGTIKLEVAPEVSSLDYANGLTYQGFNIPGLAVRKVKTEVEMENNQSFAIAGLLDNRVTENFSKLPGLGDIPVLGKLFQSRSLNRANSELLVVVTPELVQAIPAGNEPHLDMPKSFLKDIPTTVPGGNPPDTRPLGVQSQIPFEGVAKQTAVQPSIPEPAISLGLSK